MRVEGVKLEDKSYVALRWRQVRDVLVVKGDPSAGWIFQSRDHPQCGCFSTSRGTQEDDKFPFVNTQVNTPDCPRAVGVDFLEVLKFEKWHN